MAEPVISVKGVSKKYRIGLAEKKSDTMLATILRGLKSPLTNLNRIRNLSKLNDEDSSIFWALRDISFDVQEGDVLGIIGHNGAGKSTLLKILSQITEPSIGEVKIHGRVAALLEVGTGFHPELTGRENIYMNGTILGMTKKEINRKLDEIVDFSGVEKYLDTPVKFYSSGMRVRLGFAVAAHLEPEILIIDEVLSVGDADFQKKCLGKMEDVSKNGRTVLFVSHNMMALKSICKTGILLNHGKISHSGTSGDVVNHYLQSYAPQSQIEFSERDETAQSEKIFLRGVSVTSKMNDGRIDITEPFSISLQLKNKSIAGKFNVNLFFNAPDGTSIFVAVSGVEQILPGYFNAECFVPAHILNDDFYNLDVMVVEGAKPIFNMKSVITIQGIEPPRDHAWMGKFPGLIRPNFQWKLIST